VNGYQLAVNGLDNWVDISKKWLKIEIGISQKRYPVKKKQEEPMSTTAKNNYYWEGERVRLRPMHANDVELWLAEERSDSEAVRFLNCGMDLPKSERAAQSFAERYAEFNN
jgi:hypothetical protein